MKHKIIISAIDLFLIDKIRALRITSNPSVSEKTLSIGIGHADNFIEEIESLTTGKLYTARELNLIANYFDIKISDIFPEEAIKDDLLELEIEIIKISHTNIQTDKYGNVLKNYRILSGRIFKYMKQ
ncbi:hypothetical protein SAMN05421741_12429 [Paenimyroides ummariense]|uniref:HTH cro/C1-type domain-containing protein n=1 Tax=Paenimyroides ummariense TaxID=913024 RepID=A0A1I5F321_9FLAO|nr:hypothetical protein [Paenimyroides ummariense]SFO18019.1 hypothetical protein SAMN05421741_12429 [Paenimyroides ummariense]